MLNHKILPGLALTMALACQAHAQTGNSLTDSENLVMFQDRLAIENVMQDYVRGLDGTDVDSYLATLTDDASFLSKEGNYIGKEAIADFVRPVLEGRQQSIDSGEGYNPMHHVITNQALQFIDKNNAVMRSYWTLMVKQDDGSVSISAMGSSEDYFVKQNGKWLIRERRVETL